MRRVNLLRALAVASVVAAASNCSELIGLSEFHDAICTPGEESSQDCPYPGPAGTKGVGICKAGVRVCARDGLSWSACSEPTLPRAEEDCATPDDDNCDGSVNEASAGCCEPGAMLSCYSGPDGTEGIGACKPGTQVCGSDGKPAGACTGDVTPAQETCADESDEDCDGRDCAQWAALFGDGAAQAFGDVAVDSAGNIVAGGSLFGSITINGSPLTEAGSGDALLVKVDPSGKPLWARALGDVGEQVANAVAVDSTGSIIFDACSETTLDIGGVTIPQGEFLAKLSADGQTLVWVKSLGTTACTGDPPAVARIAITATNDIVVAGTLKGTIDFGTGPMTDAGGGDAFVARLRGADGAVSPGGWVHVLGDTQAQEATDLVIDSANGDVLVVGQFYGTMSVGTSISATSKDSYDAFLLRIWGDTGTPIALTTFGGAGYQFAHGVASAGGGHTITGTFDGTIDCGGAASLTAPANTTAIYAINFGPGDTFAWCKSYAPTGAFGAPAAIGRDLHGNIVVTGFFAGAIDFGGGALSAPSMGYATFLTKLTPMGTQLWAKSFDGVLPFATTRARVLPTGETIMAGFTPAPIDFGTGLLTPAGTDAFIAKFGL